MAGQSTDSAVKKLVFKSVRFDPDLAEALADYVHEKKKIVKTTVDAEIQRAVRTLISEGPGTVQTGAAASEAGSSPKRKSFRQPRTELMHEKLEAILNSRDEAAIAAAVSNLELLFDRLKSKSGSERAIDRG